MEGRPPKRRKLTGDCLSTAIVIEDDDEGASTHEIIVVDDTPPSLDLAEEVGNPSEDDANGLPVSTSSTLPPDSPLTEFRRLLIGLARDGRESKKNYHSSWLHVKRTRTERIDGKSPADVAPFYPTEDADELLRQRWFDASTNSRANSWLDRDLEGVDSKKLREVYSRFCAPPGWNLVLSDRIVCQELRRFFQGGIEKLIIGGVAPKEVIPAANLINSLRLNGVRVPDTLLVSVFEFLVHDLAVLSSVGSVCSVFRRCLLASWKELAVNCVDLKKVPRIVMQSIQHVVFDEKVFHQQSSSSRRGSKGGPRISPGRLIYFCNNIRADRIQKLEFRTISLVFLRTVLKVLINFSQYKVGRSGVPRFSRLQSVSFHLDGLKAQVPTDIRLCEISEAIEFVDLGNLVSEGFHWILSSSGKSLFRLRELRGNFHNVQLPPFSMMEDLQLDFCCSEHSPRIQFKVGWIASTMENRCLRTLILKRVSREAIKALTDHLQTFRPDAPAFRLHASTVSILCPLLKNCDNSHSLGLPPMTGLLSGLLLDSCVDLSLQGFDSARDMIRLAVSAPNLKALSIVGSFHRREGLLENISEWELLVSRLSSMKKVDWIDPRIFGRIRERVISRATKGFFFKKDSRLQFFTIVTGDKSSSPGNIGLTLQQFATFLYFIDFESLQEFDVRVYEKNSPTSAPIDRIRVKTVMERLIFRRSEKTVTACWKRDSVGIWCTQALQKKTQVRRPASEQGSSFRSVRLSAFTPRTESEGFDRASILS